MGDGDPQETRVDEERRPSTERTTADERVAGSSQTITIEGELGDLLRGIVERPGTSRLRVLGEVARGGMGTVLAVVDEVLRRRTALKVLHADPDRLQRRIPAFLREVQITAQLDHPNIVPVHDVGVEEDGRVHFCMKLVEGQTLRDYIEGLPRRPLEAGELVGLLEILIRACDAMAFAHARGVIHCDLTPLNLMIGEFGQVYVMDWGIARTGAAKHTRRVGQPVVTSVDAPHGDGIIGTPAYMSPEHAGASVLDDRSDVFQLGGLLYYALTRRAPFKAGNPELTVMMARVRELQTPREAAPWAEIPVALERIVMHAMAEDPADRFQTASELREAMVRFMWGGDLYQRVKVPAGEHVVQEGEMGDAAYIIDHGIVEVYRVFRGERVPLRRMGPGEVFGEMAILTASPRTASVIALEDCELQVVSRTMLERELEGMKPWMGVLTRALARRFKQREDELLEQSSD